MRIAAWNVNSVRQRLDHLLRWLGETGPDVVCLQEIKCLDDAFPRAEIEAAGYNVATHGQKTFNGVALLTRRPAEIVLRGLPGDDDDPQARYIEAVTQDEQGRALRVASIYLPNGNPVGTEKFAYKLAFMRRLEARARALLALEEPFALAGDFNVIPAPEDARRPQDWTGDALFQPSSRAAFHALQWLGLVDALRAVHPGEPLYTFWDYQAGAWQKDNGIRIDHILLSPEAAARLTGAEVDRRVRGWDKPSDHTPVRVDLR